MAKKTNKYGFGKYRVDAMDLHKCDIKVLKQYIAWLEKEPGGISVPIKAKVNFDERGLPWFDEWFPAVDWDEDKR